MPVLDILSGNQFQAVSGRRRRPILGDLLLQARADLPAQLAFQQRERELTLQAKAMTRQEQAQREAAAAQERAQQQQVIGTAISGVGRAGALYPLVKDTGVLKSLGLSGGGTAATAAPATTEGAALLAAEESAGMAATGAGATGAEAATGFPALASAGGAAAGASIAAAGAIGGKLTGQQVEQKVGGTWEGKLAGHATGAATGAALGALAGTVVFPGIGTAAGAVIGAAAGGLSATFCILVTACAEHPDEIALARRYRDAKMSKAAIRGYYMLAEPIAARMHTDAAYCHQIRRALVLPLLRFGAHELEETRQRPSLHDEDISIAFLELCEGVGESVRQYTRQTGEVV